MAILNLGIGPKGPRMRVSIAPDPAMVAARKVAGLPPIPPHLCDGLIDTGAKDSIVDASVVHRLGLEAVGEILVHSATSGQTPLGRPVHGIEVTITSGAKSMAMTLTAVESDLSAFGVGVLLGRDLLARCLLVYNGPKGEFSLAF